MASFRALSTTISRSPLFVAVQNQAGSPALRRRGRCGLSPAIFPRELQSAVQRPWKHACCRSTTCGLKSGLRSKQAKWPGAPRCRVPARVAGPGQPLAEFDFLQPHGLSRAAQRRFPEPRRPRRRCLWESPRAHRQPRRLRTGAGWRSASARRSAATCGAHRYFGAMPRPGADWCQGWRHERCTA